MCVIILIIFRHNPPHTSITHQPFGEMKTSLDTLMVPSCAMEIMVNTKSQRENWMNTPSCHNFHWRARRIFWYTSCRDEITFSTVTGEDLWVHVSFHYDNNLHFTNGKDNLFHSMWRQHNTSSSLLGVERSTGPVGRSVVKVLRVWNLVNEVLCFMLSLGTGTVS